MHRGLLTPDIRFDGEGVVCKALWCRPFDGELGSGVGSVSVAGHQAAQTKVCNFHNVIFTHQAISCRQVPEERV